MHPMQVQIRYAPNVSWSGGSCERTAAARSVYASSTASGSDMLNGSAAVGIALEDVFAAMAY